MPREYGIVRSTFWNGETGRAIRRCPGCGLRSQALALYLMTGPAATSIGVYHLPVVNLTGALADTTAAQALEGLRSLVGVGFIEYDEESEWVWVKEMAAQQIARRLDPKDKRVKHVAKEWAKLPKLPFLQGFYDRYGRLFHIPLRAGVVRRKEGASEVERSQEHEQGQEQEQSHPPAFVAPARTRAREAAGDGEARAGASDGWVGQAAPDGLKRPNGAGFIATPPEGIDPVAWSAFKAHFAATRGFDGARELVAVGQMTALIRAGLSPAAVSALLRSCVMRGWMDLTEAARQIQASVGSVRGVNANTKHSTPSPEQPPEPIFKTERAQVRMMHSFGQLSDDALKARLKEIDAKEAQAQRDLDQASQPG